MRCQLSCFEKKRNVHRIELSRRYLVKLEKKQTTLKILSIDGNSQSDTEVAFTFEEEKNEGNTTSQSLRLVLVRLSTDRTYRLY